MCSFWHKNALLGHHPCTVGDEALFLRVYVLKRPTNIEIFIAFEGICIGVERSVIV